MCASKIHAIRNIVSLALERKHAGKLSRNRGRLELSAQMINISQASSGIWLRLVDQ